MMDLLKRELAPITPEGWRAVDQEARRVLELNLGGRKLVDFDGPHGWNHASVNLGHLDLLGAAPDGVHRARRKVFPLAELRVPARLEIMQLDAAARGAADPDLSPLITAAESIAKAEDAAIFGGDEVLGISGILQTTPHGPLTLPQDAAQYPHVITDAIQFLRNAGITGPYGLAVGEPVHNKIARAADDGYPIRRRLSQILGGPIARSTALDGAVVMSNRGGDFVLTVGQDLSAGYANHDRDLVEIYLTESFAFRVLEPSAAIALRHE